MEDELDMETQLEREFAAEQEELLELQEEEEEDENDDDLGEESLVKKKEKETLGDKLAKHTTEQEVEHEGSDEFSGARPGLSKVRSLPSNFIYNPPAEREKTTDGICPTTNRTNSIYITYLCIIFLLFFFLNLNEKNTFLLLLTESGFRSFFYRQLNFNGAWFFDFDGRVLFLKIFIFLRPYWR